MSISKATDVEAPGAQLDTATGTPDKSGSNTRRLHTCRINPAFHADAASCIGGSVRAALPAKRGLLFQARLIGFMSMNKILILLILSGTFTPVIQPPGAELKEASYYLTARFSQSRLEYKGRLAFEPLDQPDENYPTVMVDPTKTFQTIEGFGGAFTDASSVTFSRLSPEKKKEYLRACFDPVNEITSGTLAMIEEIFRFGCLGSLQNRACDSEKVFGM